MASFFCEHKRLLTLCVECRPKPAAAPPAPAPVHLPSGTVPGAALEAAEAEPSPAAASAPRGPGKPLMPTRKRAKKVTAADVESAQAWWVKRD